jgi:hypothetical protein
MITVELARKLRAAGVRWTPAAGDRFVVVDRGMDDEVFVLSDMTVEVHQLPQGQVIGFNGTTEWALDSVEDNDAVWLPRETQLRELLAGTFRSLEQIESGWRLTVAVNEHTRTIEDTDVEQLYGEAVLQLVEG